MSSNEKIMMAKGNNRNQSGGFVPVIKNEEKLSNVKGKYNMTKKNGQDKKRGPYSRDILFDENAVPDGYLRQTQVAKMLGLDDADLTHAVKKGHIHAYVVHQGGKERRYNAPVYVKFKHAKNHFAELTDSFHNVLQVATFLRNKGFKIGKSKIYEDVKNGHLKVAKDGSVAKTAVDEYVKKINQWFEDHKKVVSEKKGIEELSNQIFEINKKFDDLQEKINNIYDVTHNTILNQFKFERSEIIRCFLLIFEEVGGDLHNLPERMLNEYSIRKANQDEH